MNSTDLASNPRLKWSFVWESIGANKYDERVGPDHQNEMASWDRVQRGPSAGEHDQEVPVAEDGAG